MRDALIFAAGAVTGGAVAALLLRRGSGEGDEPMDYEQELDDILGIGEDENAVIVIGDKPEQVHYDSIIRDNGYSGGADGNKEEPDDAPDANIREIEESEFFELGRSGVYDMESYTFYADGTLANSISDDVIDEPRALDILGPYGLSTKCPTSDSTSSYELSPEVVYVRNDETLTLCEILYDDRTYREVTGR